MSTQIRFEPAGIEGLVAQGTTLAEAAERLGVRIELECGGQGDCTSCAVVMEQNPLSLSPLTAAEERLLTAEQLAGSARLACQARVGEGDCVVLVPPQAEARTEEEDRKGEGPAPDARERIRESFASLTVGEQVAAVVEMHVKLAEELVGAVVEGPLKAGEELLESLFGGGNASKAGEGSKSDEKAGGASGGEKGDDT